jgi:hypothetical protein
MEGWAEMDSKKWKEREKQINRQEGENNKELDKKVSKV